MTAPLDTKAAEERAEAATPGPWRVRGIEVIRDAGGLPFIQAGWVADIDPEHPNAEFIAHAREDVPALLAEVKRLSGLLARIREFAIPTDETRMFQIPVVITGDEILAILNEEEL